MDLRVGDRVELGAGRTGRIRGFFGWGEKLDSSWIATETSSDGNIFADVELDTGILTTQFIRHLGLTVTTEILSARREENADGRQSNEASSGATEDGRGDTRAGG